MTHREGTTVRWNWGQGTGEGKIVEVHTEKVTRRISGSEITRNGTKECPAYLIEQDGGQRVLKLDSEVSRV